MLKHIIKCLLAFPFLCHSEPATYNVNTTQGVIAFWDSKPSSDPSFPTIIFLHGHVSNKKFFLLQFNSSCLSKYRLVCIDLPGYGESSVPYDPEKVYSFPGFANAVAEVVQTLKLENIIVVGWSLGGHVGLELTSRLLQMKGLFITGTPPIPISIEGFSRGFCAADPVVAACFGKGNLTLEEARLMAKGAGYDGSEEKQFILDAVLQTDEGAKTIYPQSIAKGMGQNEVDIVCRWPNPIAVIVGEKDPFINNDYIMHEVPFINLWRKKVFIIEKVGHAIQIESPDLFNELVKEFAQDIFLPKK